MFIEILMKKLLFLVSIISSLPVVLALDGNVTVWNMMGMPYSYTGGMMTGWMAGMIFWMTVAFIAYSLIFSHIFWWAYRIMIIEKKKR